MPQVERFELFLTMLFSVADLGHSVEGAMFWEGQIFGGNFYGEIFWLRIIRLSFFYSNLCNYVMKYAIQVESLITKKLLFK